MRRGQTREGEKEKYIKGMGVKKEGLYLMGKKRFGFGKGYGWQGFSSRDSRAASYMMTWQEFLLLFVPYLFIFSVMEL